MTRSVELLRQAACLLDGTHDLGAASAAQLRLRVAIGLRLEAQSLCDHVRLSPDGTCRYCDAPIANPPKDPTE
jgi:hypothetical protein